MLGGSLAPRYSKVENGEEKTHSSSGLHRKSREKRTSAGMGIGKTLGSVRTLLENKHLPSASPKASRKIFGSSSWVQRASKAKQRDSSLQPLDTSGAERKMRDVHELLDSVRGVHQYFASVPPGTSRVAGVPGKVVKTRTRDAPNAIARSSSHQSEESVPSGIQRPLPRALEDQNAHRIGSKSQVDSVPPTSSMSTKSDTAIAAGSKKTSRVHANDKHAAKAKRVGSEIESDVNSKENDGDENNKKDKKESTRPKERSNSTRVYGGDKRREDKKRNSRQKTSTDDIFKERNEDDNGDGKEEGSQKESSTIFWTQSAASSSKTPRVDNRFEEDIPDDADEQVGAKKDDKKKKKKCSQQRFPFHHACTHKPKPELLLELLRLHPSTAKKRDDNGNLPIHCLATDCGSAFVPVLIELICRYPKGVDQEDGNGQLPIHRVCRSKKKMSTAVVKVLLTASPSCLTKRVDGCLPLHLLCLNARSDPGVVELVATEAPMAAAAATTAEEAGKFPLHIACNVKSKNMSTIVATLMSVAPEVAAIPCSNNEYPLHVASASGDPYTISSILNMNPKAARICDHQGSLPVNVAYLRWHLLSLSGGEGDENNKDTSTLEAVLVLLQAYPEGLYHTFANGDGRIIDSACKKPEGVLEMFLTSAYPMQETIPSSLRVEDSIPEDAESAVLHVIPNKAVTVLKRLHPQSVHVTREGADGYVIAPSTS